MSRRHFYNLLTFLPIVVAMAFGISLWQSQGSILYNHSLKDLNISGYFSIPEASAQTTTPSNCVDPKIAGASEGRIYYNKGCQQFRMSKNGGAWEEFGGGVWKRFSNPSSPISINDIYNSNTGGNVYVTSNLIVGVTDFGLGSTSANLASLIPGQNLYYGAANYGTQDFNLLKLESYKGSTTGYYTAFSVNRDGVVTVGANGEIITPKLCFNSESDCLTTSGNSGTSDQASTEIYWVGLTQGGSAKDPASTELIQNKNLVPGGSKDVGGNVKITRDLTVNGTLTINTHTAEPNIPQWADIGLSNAATPARVTGSWLDVYTTFNMYVDNYDLTSGSQTTDPIGFVTTDTGSLYRIRPTPKSSASNPLYLSDGTPKKVDFPGQSLTGVCSAGSGDGVYNGNRVFVVGKNGFLSNYGYFKDPATGVSTWGWGNVDTTNFAKITGGGVSKLADINAAWCRMVGTYTGPSMKYEVVVVGQYGFIGRMTFSAYNPSPTFQILRPATFGQKDLRAIWGSNYNYNAAVSNYIAVGDADNASTNNVYLFDSATFAYDGTDHTTPVNLPSHNLNFKAVAGRNMGQNNPDAPHRWLFIGGDKGELYRGELGSSIANTASSFQEVNSGTSAYYDITGFVVSDGILVSSLRFQGDADSMASKRVSTALLKYVWFDHLTFQLLNNADSNVDNWDPLGPVYKPGDDISFYAIAGAASLYKQSISYQGSAVARFYRVRLLVMPVGGQKGLVYYHKTVWEFERDNFVYQGGLNVPCTANCLLINIEPHWSSDNIGAATDFKDVWSYPSDSSVNINNLVTYVAGDPGAIYSSTGLHGAVSEKTSLPSSASFGFDGVYGADLNFIATSGWYNDAGTKKGIILTKQGNTGNFNLDNSCKFTTTDQVNSVWVVKSANNYTGYAVANSGKLYKISTLNYATQAACSDVTPSSGWTTGNLLGIHGVPNGVNYDLYVSGVGGFAAKASVSGTDGSLGTWSAITGLNSDMYWKIFGKQGSPIYAVGQSTYNTSYDIYTINGTTASKVTISDNYISSLVKGQSVNDVAIGSTGIVYFAVNGGMVVTYDATDTTTPWKVSQTPTSNNIRALFFSPLSGSGSVLVAVGDKGAGYNMPIGVSADNSGDLIVARGNLSVPFNTWGPQTDWVSQCDDGQFVIKVDVLLGKVKCAKL